MDVSIPRLPIYYGTFQSFFCKNTGTRRQMEQIGGIGCVLGFHPGDCVCILRLSCVCRFVNDWPRPHHSLGLQSVSAQTDGCPA